MTKRFAIVITILAIIFGGTFAWYLLRVILTKHYFATLEMPAITVSTTIAQKETWHPMLNSVGTLQAINGVQVNSEVNGQVTQLHFTSGQVVKKGDPLVQLDDLVDQQKLNNNVATLNLNEANYRRQVALYKLGATSKLSLDTAKAQMLQAKAEVTSAQVMVAKKNIKAPFDGKLGIRQVNLGQYVTAGQAMVLLQMLDPLHVNFDLSEQYLKELQAGQKVQITTDAQKGKVFDGTITAIDSTVNVATRSISVQATFPNKDLKLYPGLFADVNVILPEEQGVITVPQTAVTYSLFGDSIYVVTKSKDKKGKPILIAQQKFITVGERRGTVIAIKKGIVPGDEVVTSGQLKLHPGSLVVINNSIKLN